MFLKISINTKWYHYFTKLLGIKEFCSAQSLLMYSSFSQAIRQSQFSTDVFRAPSRDAPHWHVQLIQPCLVAKEFKTIGKGTHQRLILRFMAEEKLKLRFESCVFNLFRHERNDVGFEVFIKLLTTGRYLHQPAKLTSALDRRVKWPLLIWRMS